MFKKVFCTWVGAFRNSRPHAWIMLCKRSWQATFSSCIHPWLGQTGQFTQTGHSLQRGQCMTNRTARTNRALGLMMSNWRLGSLIRVDTDSRLLIEVPWRSYINQETLLIWHTKFRRTKATYLTSEIQCKTCCQNVACFRCSVLNQKWKEKSSLIGQLEKQVTQMKEFWLSKEVKLVEERDKAVGEARWVSLDASLRHRQLSHTIHPPNSRPSSYPSFPEAKYSLFLFFVLYSALYWVRWSSGLEHSTGDWVVLGSNAADAISLRNFGNSVYPALPVSFGGDTKSCRSLLSGVYASRLKRPHAGGKCVTRLLEKNNSKII